MLHLYLGIFPSIAPVQLGSCHTK